MDFILEMIYVLPAVLIAISLHEFAHGLVSYKLGDPTPKLQGRLSINPFAHLDIMGTLALIFFKFGWAKPVSVNSEYYENRKTGMVKVALAGPLMNFFVAFISLFVLQIIEKYYSGNSMLINYTLGLLGYIAIINIGLGAFNLIPIPPLDGSKVLAAVLPTEMYFSYMRFEMYGSFLIILFLYMRVLDGPLMYCRDLIMSGMINIIGKII